MERVILGVSVGGTSHRTKRHSLVRTTITLSMELTPRLREILQCASQGQGPSGKQENSSTVGETGGVRKVKYGTKYSNGSHRAQLILIAKKRIHTWYIQLFCYEYDGCELEIMIHETISMSSLYCYATNVIAKLHLCGRGRLIISGVS